MPPSPYDFASAIAVPGDPGTWRAALPLELLQAIVKELASARRRADLRDWALPVRTAVMRAREAGEDARSLDILVALEHLPFRLERLKLPEAGQPDGH